MNEFLDDVQEPKKESGLIHSYVAAKNFDELMDALKTWKRENNPGRIFTFKIAQLNDGGWQANIYHL